MFFVWKVASCFIRQKKNVNTEFVYKFKVENIVSFRPALILQDAYLMVKYYRRKRIGIGWAYRYGTKWSKKKCYSSSYDTYMRLFVFFCVVISVNMTHVVVLPNHFLRFDGAFLRKSGGDVVTISVLANVTTTHSALNEGS